MKRISVLLAILLLLAAAGGCEAKNGAANSPAPSVGAGSAATEPAEGEQPADESPAESPGETQTAGAEASPEVYTEIIQLEGADEEVRYRLVQGGFGYTIPMDVDRFSFEEGRGADYYRSTANENVYMEVSRLEGGTAADAARAFKEDAAVMRLEESAVKIGAYDALKIHVVYGNEPESKVADHYLIEDGGDVWVISSVYSLETAEGFGARMQYMIQDFRICAPLA
jgi:hypothetical protein